MQIWRGGPARGKWGAQETQFVAPCLARHSVGLDKIHESGFAALTVVYAVPMDRGRTRLINRVPLKARFVRPVLSATCRSPLPTRAAARRDASITCL